MSPLLCPSLNFSQCENDCFLQPQMPSFPTMTTTSMNITTTTMLVLPRWSMSRSLWHRNPMWSRCLRMYLCSLLGWMCQLQHPQGSRLSKCSLKQDILSLNIFIIIQWIMNAVILIWIVLGKQGRIWLVKGPRLLVNTEIFIKCLSKYYHWLKNSIKVGWNHIAETINYKSWYCGDIFVHYIFFPKTDNCLQKKTI